MVLVARTRREELNALADTALLTANAAARGCQQCAGVRRGHHTINGPVNNVHAADLKAEEAHRALPAPLLLGELNPGQQVLGCVRRSAPPGAVA